MVTVLRQLGEKTSGRLRPEQCIAAGDLPQMLADGARGVNQSLLPLPRDVVGPSFSHDLVRRAADPCSARS